MNLMSTINDPQIQAPAFRFSGHQTFPLRIAWLPKVIREIFIGRDPLTNIDEGIVSLGLGKNMVEGLRCWIEAFQIASKADARWVLSPVGDLVFAPNHGLDPYLEDHSSNWLLHWLISTNTRAPFFAWECLLVAAPWSKRSERRPSIIKGPLRSLRSNSIGKSFFTATARRVGREEKITSTAPCPFLV